MNLLSSISKGIASLFHNNRFFISILYQLGYRGEVWISTDDVKQIYEEIPQAKIVIEKFANLFSNAEIYIERKEGKDWVKVDNHPAYETIYQPNFDQGQNTFYKDLAIKYNIYGNNFQYFNKPSSVGGVVGRFNMSPRYLKPILTGKYFDQIEMKGVVSGYIYEDSMTTKKPIDVKDILWIKNADVDNPLLGVSKLVTLKYPMSTVKGSYSYLNAVINNKGMLGFIVNKSVESGGTKPMSQEDKDKLNKQYSQDYGHGDGQIPFAVLNGDADFKNTSYPVKEMMLFETIEHGIVVAAHMYGINPNLFLTNTTFENLKSGLVHTYQDSIIPFADMVSQNETKKFIELGILKPNERTRFSYEHLEILQESKLSGVAAIERAISALNNAVANGLMTIAEAKPIIDRLIITIS